MDEDDHMPIFLLFLLNSACVHLSPAVYHEKSLEVYGFYVDSTTYVLAYWYRFLNVTLNIKFEILEILDSNVLCNLILDFPLFYYFSINFILVLSTTVTSICA